MEKSEKRYIVTMDMYVYAKNDKKAYKKIAKILKKLDSMTGGHPQVISLADEHYVMMNTEPVTNELLKL